MYDVSMTCFIFINFNTHTQIYVYSTPEVPKYPISKSGVLVPVPIPVPVPVPTFPGNLENNQQRYAKYARLIN